MERKSLVMELRADGAGEVTGYGSVFGGVDSYGDTIMPGAFQKSIGTRKPKMLWQHRMDKPIGVWDEVVEDGKGLRLKGRLAETAQGREAAELVRMGALDGLSIGFRTMADEVEGNVRKLKEVDLYEVSFVTMPADSKARVTGIKSEREIEEILREHGFSRREAKAFVARGWKGVSDLRDAGEEDPNSALRDAGMVKDELQRILERLGL
jgi:HK97 family phage prohead protease